MYKYLVDDSSDEYDIYINLISSPAGIYLSRRPYLIPVIKELLTKHQLSGKRVVIEQDMGRNIGTTDIVATEDKDIIYYAQAIKSDTYSRFIKNKYPQASSKLTIVAERNEDGDYMISDAWIGSNHPPFPGDDIETTESKSYWGTHALVHDSLAIQSKTITKECPY